MSKSKYKKHNILPQRPETHITSEKGIAVFRESLSEHWIFRELQSDYGIDCEVEITDESSSVTGALIKAQVKCSKQGGTNTLQVRTETVRYWLILPVPVIIVLVTLEPPIVKWLDVRLYLNMDGRLDTIYSTKQKTLAFNFSDANLLPDSFRELKNLAEWHQEDVSTKREEVERKAGGHFVGFRIAKVLFNGKPEEWLKYLREQASDEQVADDFPFVFWLKKMTDEDPDFIERINRQLFEECTEEEFNSFFRKRN